MYSYKKYIVMWMIIFCSLLFITLSISILFIGYIYSLPGPLTVITCIISFIISVILIIMTFYIRSSIKIDEESIQKTREEGGGPGGYQIVYRKNSLNE